MLNPVIASADLRSRARAACALLVLVFTLPAVALAQGGVPDPAARDGQSAVPVVRLPAVLVTALKEPSDVQETPVSVTGVPAQTLIDAGVDTVSEAGIYAPNVHFTEFTARKLSNARFRGIGSSPANPAITTYLDGVPQLHANTSSIDLLQIDQIEFVRGPQSALFGRNAIGGVINVTTRRPVVGGRWSGSAETPFSNESGRGISAEASGPVVGNRLGAGVAFQYARRDGYTRNVVTGNDLDFRSGFSAKGQLLWTPSDQWEARVIVSGERNRDGDYALSDLAGLRASPFNAARDFEGFTDRDVTGTTVLTRWQGTRLAVTTTTGFLSWRTEDATDLDYLPMPLITRDNVEEAVQFTQEVRVGSLTNAPIRLSDTLALRWQAGAVVFTQDYEQDAVNAYAPFVLSPFLNFPVNETSPQAALDDVGVGVYGQGTVTVGGRLDLLAGVRADRERKEAVLESFMTPAVFPGNTVTESRTFTDVSPQFAASLRLSPRQIAYATVARGYKAGGFNPASPPGSDAYGEEHSWNVEGGIKTLWAGGRVTANASVFRIAWEELQLNLPDPFAPGRFYIANAGSAASTGAEVEIMARALEGVQVFGVFGYTRAQFGDGVVIGSTNISGNAIPNTPDFTTTVGAQLTHAVRGNLSVYGRGEVHVRGAFHYDEGNLEGQDAYSLTNLRAGVRVGMVFVEGWVRNAFDTQYIPVAFAYPGLAPSGFIGEMGTPRTFGVTTGVRF